MIRKGLFNFKKNISSFQAFENKVLFFQMNGRVSPARLEGIRVRATAFMPRRCRRRKMPRNTEAQGSNNALFLFDLSLLRPDRSRHGFKHCSDPNLAARKPHVPKKTGPGGPVP
jgi:hypothetical protein